MQWLTSCFSKIGDDVPSVSDIICSGSKILRFGCKNFNAAGVTIFLGIGNDDVGVVAVVVDANDKIGVDDDNFAWIDKIVGRDVFNLIFALSFSLSMSVLISVSISVLIICFVLILSSFIILVSCLFKS